MSNGHGVERIPSSFGKFSDSTSAGGPGRFVFISGQVGAGPDLKLVGGGFAAEAAQCFALIRESVERAGGSMADVVKINAFITSLDDYYGEYARAREDAFGDAQPASATVEVAKLLLGAHLEVDAVAFLADR